MNLKSGVRNKELKSSSDETKIFNRVKDHFKNKSEYTSQVVSNNTKNIVSLRKIGSDLTFKLIVGEEAHSYLELYITDVSSSGFSKKLIGSIEYNPNGSCANKRKLCLPLKRQQLELSEVIDEVEKSLRPNSINFIMGD